MPRPSSHADQALLASGRALFPALGCSGLTVRALTEHAGVNLGMFHYHFRTKRQFLSMLLQQMYEDLFERVRLEADRDASASERLRGVLFVLARTLREQRQTLARLWLDTAAGEPVAREFIRRNMPRHVRVLLALFEAAERDGVLRPAPAAQRFVFVMGAVGMPVLFGAGLIEVGADGGLLAPRFDAEVLSDRALAQRIDWALAALAENSR